MLLTLHFSFDYEKCACSLVKIAGGTKVQRFFLGHASDYLAQDLAKPCRLHFKKPSKLHCLATVMRIVNPSVSGSSMLAGNINIDEIALPDIQSCAL